MNSKKLFATIAISTMLLTGCTLNNQDTIIRVNGKNITQAQFDKSFDKQANNSMLQQMVKVNNGVSDKVILNNTTDGKNYKTIKISHL